MVTIEEIQEDALALAKIRQISHDDAVEILIAHHGRENVTGLDATTDDDTTLPLGTTTLKPE